MAKKVLVTETYLSDIAAAIREKNGSEDTYLPSAMSEAIREISGSSFDGKPISCGTAQTANAQSLKIDFEMDKEPERMFVFLISTDSYPTGNAVIGIQSGSVKIVSTDYSDIYATVLNNGTVTTIDLDGAAYGYYTPPDSSSSKCVSVTYDLPDGYNFPTGVPFGWIAY